jgi:CRP-like cAMP-binding protein
MAPDLLLNRALTDLTTRYHACSVDLPALRASLSGMPRDVLAPGAVIYREGDPSECLHLVLEGTVRVSTGPTKTVLTSITAPAFLGHLGILTGLPRSAHIDTISAVTVIRLNQRQVTDMTSARTPQGQAFRRLLLAAMGDLLAETNRSLIELVSQVGQPIPRDAARLQAEPVSRPPAPSRYSSAHAADRLANTFDASLLEMESEIRLVRTAEDERNKYKR